ncbi:restriction endonuclease [Erysipelothrix larvae]|uniref:Restriction endonuclease n=1 Tax=Erysipelothrix larvae TaxID=1514105 RepID=A0A109UH40_9FIRM|nr:restriction endonuclease subunit S [Erysipelothrix larvae]AMC93707.1 restriction endonuclease [Erysipelothrix larvae]
MNAQDLKNSILQLAIQGKLVEQREEEGTAGELIEKIQAERKQLFKEGKIKKQKKLPEIKEDEIPFDIPESWEWVRLIDLSLFIKAGGDKPKDFLKSKTETHTVPVIANGIQNDGIIGYTKEATIEESCITVSGRGTIGFSCLRTEPFTPVVRLLVINISDQLDNKYVQNVLTALLEKGVGTSIKQLTVPMIEPKLIPLPPLEEQKRIVAKIEELMPYVEQYDKAYTEVEELNKKFPEDMQKSILQYAIQGKLVEQREEDGTAEDLYKQIQEEKKKLIKEGKIKKTKVLPEITEDEIPFDIPENWKWVRLGELLYKLTDGTHSTPKYTATGVPFISVKDISSGKMDFSNTKFISQEEHESLYKRCDPERDDILLTKVGTTGIPVIVDTDKEFSLFVSVALLKFNTELIYNKYFMYVIKAPVVQIQARENTRGVGNKNWVMRDIANTILPLPPLGEQKRIVEKIEEMLPQTKQLVKE